MEYRYATIRELAGALRSGQASPGELAEAALSALDRHGRALNAIATLIPDRAAAEGVAAKRRLASGDASLLCGIPYGAKDLFAARGAPTTWGTRAYATRVIDDDATVVRRLGAAGAVLVAKLAMSEFAGGGRAATPGASMHGSGRNPWAPDRYSGGSSSGSGIAVAAGLLPFALGTETGGSVLGPAAFSGVTGLRPTVGLVPRRGVMMLSWTLDKVGVLARTAEDCALVMDALTGGRAGAGSREFRDAALEPSSGDVDRIRIGFEEDESAELDPGIRRAYEAAIAELRGVATTFVPVRVERDDRYTTMLEEIVRIEGAFEFRAQLADPGFRMTDERQQATLRSGLEAPALGYLEATRVAVPRAVSAFGRLFDQVDVIVAASRVSTAPPLDAVRAPRDPSKLSDQLRAAGNLAGVPGVSIPCGLAEDGLPVALQLVGPRGSDARLLGLASRFQARTGHHRLRPPDPAGSGLAA